MKWFWIVCLCLFTLPVFAQTIEKKVLLEGQSVLIPYSPIENAFVADPEFALLELTPDGHSVLTALRAGMTWVYFWYQGAMHQWEIEVKADPLLQLKQSRTQKTLLDRYFDLRNQYQLNIQSQFSERDITNPIFLHSLTTSYEFRKLRSGVNNSMRFRHQGFGGGGDFQPNAQLVYIQPSLRTRYLDASYGDFSMQQGSGSNISSDFAIRGGNITLHDFLRSDQGDQSAVLTLFGGGEYTGGEQFGFGFDKGRAFGAQWHHTSSPYHDFNMSSLIFRTQNNPDYITHLAQDAKFPLGKGGGSESLLVFPEGFAGRGYLSQQILSWLNVSGNYGFVPHRLRSFRAVNQNDVHSYGMGFGEQVSKKWHLSQGYGGSLIAGRSGTRRKGEAHSGGLGAEWYTYDEKKQYEPRHLSLRYQINYDTLQEAEAALDLERDAHQGSIFYSYRFSKERTLASQASYQYDNHRINQADREAWQASVYYSFHKEQEKTKAYGAPSWAAGLRASQRLKPQEDHSAFATGQYQISWLTKSIQLTQELGFTDGSQVESEARSITSLGFSWTLHPRHWLYAFANMNTRMDTPNRGDRIVGTLLLTYSWNLGGGLSSAPKKKIRLKKKAKDFRGVVFQDNNGNQRQESGEMGVKGVKIQITGLKTIETDAKGKFLLKGLKEGFYTLKIDLDTIPEGWVLDGLSEYPLAATREGFSPSTLSLAIAKQVSSLAVYLFDDIDQDQKLGYEDIGIPDVTLLAQKDGETLRCQTSGSGYCIFSPLSPGTWEVSIDLSEGTMRPADTEFLKTSQTITIEEIKAHQIQFLARTLHVLKGEIFLDKDQNRRRSEGDLPLKNVGIRIDTQRTTSDDQGNFLMRGLKPGSYPIQVLGGLPNGTYVPEAFLQVSIPKESGVIEIKLPVRKK